jgi:hypothetical protein
MLRLGDAHSENESKIREALGKTRFMTSDLEKNISFLEMDSRRNNATYNLLKIDSSVQIGE